MKRLFVHIPKNGGMTIRKGIPGKILVADPQFHVSGQYTSELYETMAEHGEHHGAQHARWRDFREDLRNTRRAFAIVRNPWDRTVSRYTFSCVAEGKDYTFREFLEERHEYGGKPYFWHRAIRGWYPQVDYVTDEGGKLQCDILRFGTDDVLNYFELKKPLDVRNVSNGQAIGSVIKNRKDYRDFYGPDEFEIVRDWYHKDIEFFGFTFEGGASRNLWLNS